MIKFTDPTAGTDQNPAANTQETAEKIPVVWVVTEGMIGTENQAVGITEALGLTPVVKRFKLREPWKSLSPYLSWESANTFEDPADLIAGPAPDLVMTAGRKAIAAMRYLKKTLPHRPLFINVLDPRAARKEFDLIVSPKHDPARGANVLHTVATPNRITAQRLQDAAIKWGDAFKHLVAPRVAVVIGGKSKAYSFSDARAMQLVRLLEPLLDNGASLMITVSRRTPDSARKVLEDHLANRPQVFFWDNHGDNPYAGMLALADYILVTADSTAMLSDAATTGKPVYILPLTGGHKRIEKMHAHLIERGAACWFAGQLDPAWEYEPLNDAAMAAEHIRGLLEYRGFTLPAPPLTSIA
jgi:mitochondrial fission protein ELM1